LRQVGPAWRGAVRVRTLLAKGLRRTPDVRGRREKHLSGRSAPQDGGHGAGGGRENQVRLIEPEASGRKIKRDGPR
jgi:hypothetical protein